MSGGREDSNLVGDKKASSVLSFSIRSTLVVVVVQLVHIFQVRDGGNKRSARRADLLTTHITLLLLPPPHISLEPESRHFENY